jgi:CheY-like chemotaxis protein
MLRAVFELFTQVDGSTHRSRGGLGIGLALVDRLVAMHGGTVRARSEGVDRGTELEVRLPRHVGAPAPEVVAVEPARRTPTSAVRVLIVDDNVDAAEAAAMLLELEGHEVRTASDGLQALDLGADFGPELVLLDIGMPHLDGYETARRMREQPWGRATRLVAVTGWGQARDRDRTAQSGFDDHLVKPVGSEELLELVARAAKRSA